MAPRCRHTTMKPKRHCTGSLGLHELWTNKSPETYCRNKKPGRGKRQVPAAHSAISPAEHAKSYTVWRGAVTTRISRVRSSACPCKSNSWYEKCRKRKATNLFSSANFWSRLMINKGKIHAKLIVVHFSVSSAWHGYQLTDTKSAKTNEKGFNLPRKDGNTSQIATQ